MCSVRIKGAGVAASVDWMRTTYGESCWRGIVAALPVEDRERMEDVLAADWVPVETEDRRWRAFAEHCHPDDPAATEAAFVQMGRDIAQRNLTGVYQLVETMLRPEASVSMNEIPM